MRHLFIFFLVMTSTVFAIGQTSEIYVVTPANPQGWYFLSENSTGGTGDFVNGPAGTPLGTGSVNLSVPTSDNGYIFATNRYLGVKLSDLVELKYSTYGNSNLQAIALQFDVDNNEVDGDLGYQGRLVFEPYQIPAPVTPGVWEEWNALNGRWWGSSGSGIRPVRDACPQSNPCSTSQLLDLFPNLRVSGRFLFKAGSGWIGFEGNVDKLVIGVNTEYGIETSTWDFERYSSPTSIEDCFKGGWSTFSPPTGQFKNQGQCVSSVVPL